MAGRGAKKIALLGFVVIEPEHNTDRSCCIQFLIVLRGHTLELMVKKVIKIIHVRSQFSQL